MNTETLSYEVNGKAMASRLYIPDSEGGNAPGVLIFPEIFGLGEHVFNRAERLVALGYVVLACDYAGGGAQLAYGEGIALAKELMPDMDTVRARAAAGLQALSQCKYVDPKKIAAIGYCFGGQMALELARAGAEIAACVGFHCGLKTAKVSDAKKIKAKVLVCIGADDPSIPAADRVNFENEMRAAHVDWRMEIYGGVVHSFTNPEAESRGNNPQFARYDLSADTRSWANMLSLFEESLR